MEPVCEISKVGAMESEMVWCDQANGGKGKMLDSGNMEAGEVGRREIGDELGAKALFG